MNTKIENGIFKVDIDFHELVSSLDDEKRIELIESLSCHDSIIKHVTDQIFDGYTENGYCGGKFCSNDKTYLSALDQARYRVAMESDIISKEIIEELRKANIQLGKDNSELVGKLYNRNF